MWSSSYISAPTIIFTGAGFYSFRLRLTHQDFCSSLLLVRHQHHLNSNQLLHQLTRLAVVFLSLFSHKRTKASTQVSYTWGYFVGLCFLWLVVSFYFWWEAGLKRKFVCVIVTYLLTVEAHLCQILKIIIIKSFKFNIIRLQAKMKNLIDQIFKIIITILT